MSKKELTFKETKEIKDVLLAKKQGEALERITHPQALHESLGLGYFGAETAVGMGIAIGFEACLNELAGIEPIIEGKPNPSFSIITKTVMAIGVASGSRGAKRMEKGLETIGQLGQYYPMQKANLPTPVALTAPKKG